MRHLRSVIVGLVASIVLSSLAFVTAGEAAIARKSARHEPKPSPSFKCETPKFRIVVDVGHTPDSYGALSARNDPEFGFNFRLARLITAKLKSEGFAATRLLVTDGKARPSLFKRVGAANEGRADLFLSVHHDSVPDKLLETWEFDGAKSYFSDRFSGHSLFVSRQNPHFAASLMLARMIGRQLKQQGLHYASQYTLPVMGRYRRQLLDKDVGVYRYDGLVVLSRTRSAAVLLEAGSIINRDEEMEMNSPERHEAVAQAVAAAMREFCERR
ncbi:MULTISPECIES: N-acetylmuramoyl-L-alanine amidase [unclassified Bradyrhizobium]|uniref:N-acetylmuramoyl-L-alanine amidase n=1 Tax=unclassified Bradyrhizobium TaxID=2631580 RepID=UPI001CD3A72B|nr:MULTISPECIES: N-acetylmuramoyl-L-alanine amidase [unclassified Bradyrhizobium]MCA1377881.1 N-acetylmuramoyl-L-alanine amidase [Bradyrhizobium sp. IC4060]MCA1485005.1 N-acetylmuramoyl-L-alanine amidase [Bradyrhizobium sp. IC4061]